MELTNMEIKQSEIKNWLQERKLERTLNKIAIIICGIALAYFALHFISFLISNPEIPNIDGKSYKAVIK